MNEEIVIGVGGRVKAVVNDDNSMQFVMFQKKRILDKTE